MEKKINYTICTRKYQGLNCSSLTDHLGQYIKMIS